MTTSFQYLLTRSRSPLQPGASANILQLERGPLPFCCTNFHQGRVTDICSIADANLLRIRHSGAFLGGVLFLPRDLWKALPPTRRKLYHCNLANLLEGANKALRLPLPQPALLEHLRSGFRIQLRTMMFLLFLKIYEKRKLFLRNCL